MRYEMLKLLAGERAMFTAVGDDDQSIYGWRGATVENLRRLPEEYPALKVIPLEQNYRSTGHILRAANAVIAHNPKLFEKKLWSASATASRCAVIECDGEEHEAERAVAASSRRSAAGRPSVQGFRRALPRQPPGAHLRAGAARGAASRQGVGRARASSTAPRSRTCAPGCACSSTTTTTRLPARRDHAQRGIGHQTLASLGEFAAKWKTSLFEALFAESLGTALNATRGRLAARIRPLRERPRIPRPPHRRRGGRGAADGLAEGHRLREAPATTARKARSWPRRGWPT